jgi:undecaprenyl diphosphate synthase
MGPSLSSSAMPVTASGGCAPAHVAIIMDGNGRWAKSRGLPRSAGHKKGADALRRAMDACRERGVRYLTIYAFSSENWKRPSDEIGELMKLLKHYLHNELETLHEQGVRMRFIGDISALGSDIRELIANATERTSSNTQFHLTVALSYGARQELVRAMRKLIASGAAPEAIDENTIQGALDTADLPEPDLLIRTGGEKRLSNFLLWQCAYTEFYFTDRLWPDFEKADFDAALAEYSTRERRYGTTGA